MLNAFSTCYYIPKTYVYIYIELRSLRLESVIHILGHFIIIQLKEYKRPRDITQ